MTVETQPETTSQNGSSGATIPVENPATGEVARVSGPSPQRERRLATMPVQVGDGRLTLKGAVREILQRLPVNGWAVEAVYREEGESAKTTDRSQLQPAARDDPLRAIEEMDGIVKAFHHAWLMMPDKNLIDDSDESRTIPPRPRPTIRGRKWCTRRRGSSQFMASGMKLERRMARPRTGSGGAHTAPMCGSLSCTSRNGRVIRAWRLDC